MPASTHESRPYVPPEQAASPKEVQRYAKAWMRPLPGETEEERQARLQRTCCECGVFLADPNALMVHENSCKGPSDA